MSNDKQKNPKILVVTLGGTIESFYNPEEGTPKDVPLEKGFDRITKTVIPAAMEKLNIAEGCDFHPVAMLDSKYNSTASLDQLLHYVSEHHYDKIIVVQGTDTMPTHGQYLMRRIRELKEYMPELEQKSFVFTGAMNPLRDKNKQWRDPKEKTLDNDGWGNLCRAKNDLEVGVPFGAFVRMGHDFWPAERVRKHVETDGKGPDAKVTFSEFQGVAIKDARIHRFD